ncbi:MAG: ribosomal protein S18-alanine N-acetyltransferase [Clostridia bacterium]|nr:ribosomal protein S18-alanine N-acetyltransferase [Clostridia bacterium]
MGINKDEIQIREITQDDIHALIEIEKSQNIVILKKKDILDDLTLNQNTSLYLCACYHNEIIGYIAAHYVVDTMDIISVVTEKNYESNGIATLLLSNIFDFAKIHEVKKIFLEVRKSNESAKKLYEKCNFNMIHTRKNYYKDNNEDACIYVKEI